MNNIKKALAMKDSYRKLIRINELMLKVDYLSPIWYKLDSESRRLQNIGFTFKV